MKRPSAIRWGILGTGMIARKFAEQLPQSDSGVLAAVASRKLESARRFVAELGGSAHDGYESLLSAAEVDAVYIALPNTLHREWTLAALAARKHVLCEKPMALTAAEAQEMFARANEAQRLLMEAFMYRAHPQTERLWKKLRGGAIGRIRLIRANFTFNRAACATDARYQADAGGGSIMDVGCYCVDFARAVIGAEPVHVHASVHRHELGVDDYAAGTMAFPGGELVTFTCGMTVASDQTTHIAGTEGRIEIPRFWHAQEGFTLVRPGRKEKLYTGKGKRAAMPIYALEADAFARVIAGGENWNPPPNTIGNLRVLEELRRTAFAVGH